MSPAVGPTTQNIAPPLRLPLFVMVFLFLFFLVVRAILAVHSTDLCHWRSGHGGRDLTKTGNVCRKRVGPAANGVIAIGSGTAASLARPSSLNGEADRYVRKQCNTRRLGVLSSFFFRVLVSLGIALPISIFFCLFSSSFGSMPVLFAFFLEIELTYKILQRRNGDGLSRLVDLPREWTALGSPVGSALAC